MLLGWHHALCLQRHHQARAGLLLLCNHHSQKPAALSLS